MAKPVEQALIENAVKEIENAGKKAEAKAKVAKKVIEFYQPIIDKITMLNGIYDKIIEGETDATQKLYLIDEKNKVGNIATNFANFVLSQGNNDDTKTKLIEDIEKKFISLKVLIGDEQFNIEEARVSDAQKDVEIKVPVLNFEFQSNSCFINSLLQMILDCTDLCNNINFYAINYEIKDNRTTKTLLATEICLLLNNIIKFNEIHKNTNINRLKLKTYKDYIEPLWKKIAEYNYNFQVGKEADLLEHFVNVIIPVLDDCSIENPFKLNRREISNNSDNNNDKLITGNSYIVLTINDNNKNKNLQSIFNDKRPLVTSGALGALKTVNT